MKKFWNWFNGNKTIFGLVLLQFSTWIPPDMLFLGFIPVKDAVTYLGGLLAGTGVLHKVVKATTAPGPNL